MISTEFLGGLGNNLFQLGTALSIHKKFGYDLILPKQPQRGTIGKYGQSTILEFQNLLENKFEYSDSIKLKKYQHIDLDPSYTDFSYTPIDIQDNTSYVGYFQSEKYFLGIPINHEIKIKNQNIDYIKTKYKNFFGKKNISIHYRLGGDRTETNMQNYHKNVSLSFYEKAISCIEDFNYDEYNILVFTDNINLCNNIMKDFSKKFTVIDNDNDNVKDFTFMSLCDVNILGNSTFSWWAAYLNQNQKMVISPKTEWFGVSYKHFNTKDLFLEKWIKI